MCFIVLLCLAGCKNMGQISEVALSFKDYNFYKKSGVEELSQRDIQKCQINQTPYLTISYKKNIIDSIILYNSSKEADICSIKVLLGDSLSVYELSQYDHIFGIHKTFFVFTNNYTMNYDFPWPVALPDSTITCEITLTNYNRSIYQKGLIKQADTVDLANKLYYKKSVMLSRTNLVETLNTRLAKDLTLLNFFGK